MSVFNAEIRFLRNVDGWVRGDVTTVSLDDYVRNLESQGYVRILSTDEPPEPADTASKAMWVEFVEAHGVTVHPQSTRRQIIDAWRGVESRG